MNRTLCGLLMLLALNAGASAAGGLSDEGVERLIIRLRDGQAVRGPADAAERVRGLGLRAGIALRHLRNGAGGTQILRLPRPVGRAVAADYARRLAADPDVEAVEPDIRFGALALSPSDLHFDLQWSLQGPTGEPAAIDAVAAWSASTGSGELAVAVIDTGVLPHADLAGRTFPVDGEAYRYGYDFIAADATGEAATANDGDGRDPDPTDPGDWIEAADLSRPEFPVNLCPVGRSTWHGTHVAGILAAAGDNGLGVAGVDWESRLLPVRVLGKCGGYLSDIVDAIYWSAGLDVPGVPRNRHPARVINMSLGASSSCGPFMQGAIDAATAVGAVVVTAAGNEALDAATLSPANCRGVIAVAAVDRTGGRAYYSNFGHVVDLAAPGGTAGDPIYSTYDGGSRGPSNDGGYAGLYGTSMATPHVSGVVALMMAGHFGLTGTWLAPEQVTAMLKAAARPFPEDAPCEGCGTGIVDAARAVVAVTTSPVARIAGTPSTILPGMRVTLDGSGSDDDGAIAGWEWLQTAGTPVALDGADTAVAGFVVPAAPGERLAFRLTVTDDLGLTDSADVAVTVDAGIPTVTAEGDRTVTAGEALSYRVEGSQSDAGVPQLSAEDLPAGAAFTDGGDGSGTLTWTPMAADVGAHTITFVARNAGNPALSDSVAVTITVQAPAEGGGGGGAVGLGLVVAASAYRYRRRRKSTPPTAP